jgi:YspA, cpYpsA-related SLOG family
MKVIVCGDRRWTDRDFIHDVIAEEITKHVTSLVIVEGDARGADTIAGQVARALHLDLVIVPADWNTHGKAAGPIRNKQMLDYILPDGMIIAFHNNLHESKGTKNMVMYGLNAEIPVWHYRIDENGIRQKTRITEWS